MSVKRFDENGKELIREYKAITKDGLAGLSHEVGYSASYISQMQNGKRPVSRVLAWGLEKAIALEKFMKSNST